MDTVRRSLEPNLLVVAAGPAAVLAASPLLGPWQKLAATTFGLLYFLKLCVLTRRDVRLAPSALLLYLTIWPGMDPRSLETREGPDERAGRRFVQGLLYTMAGAAAILTVALLSPSLTDTAVAWLGIGAFLLTLHFGVSAILTALMWLGGYKVRPLFESPFSASSLRDFWTRRWNLAFVEMNRLLFLTPLTKVFGLAGAVFGVFVVSGALHELAISYPSGRGWGGPTLYFLIQGVFVVLESKLGVRSRLVTWLGVLFPLPLLFHEAFGSTFIVPVFRDLHALLVGQPAEWYVSSGLWLLGILQLSVLIASFQVPARLKWREELVRLSSFNRKLMWTQGLFIVTTIVAFAVLTLVLHDEILRGDRAALAIAAFAGVFWTMRLLVDGIYYEHEDWPEGPQFVIGHALLNCLFVLLASGYWAVVFWHA